MRSYFLAVIYILIVLQGGCKSTQPSKSSGGSLDTSGTSEPSALQSFGGEDSGPIRTGSTYVHSLSNNPMTSRIAAVNKATAYANKISQQTRGPKGQTISNFESLIAAERIARVPLARLLKHMRRLAEITRKGTKHQKVSELARLEIAVAAVQQNQYGMANFLLNDLKLAKNKKVKAGAFNAIALLAMRDGRVPEAVSFWKESLKAHSTYVPALLNLGFVSLMFGHFEATKRFLSQVEGDWFSESGLLVAERLMNNTQETSRLCTKILKTHAKHKPTLFNCGVHEWQSNKNVAKAKQLIGKALNTRGGPNSWDNRGYRVLESVR